MKDYSMSKVLSGVGLCLAGTVLLSGCGDAASAAAKAESALRDGDYAAAAKSMETAARKGEPTSELYYNIGAAKAMAGDFAGAAQAFENAEKLDVGNIEALEERAKALMARQEYAAAHELLDRAFADTTALEAQARVLNALAVCEHGLQRDELAVLRLNKATRLAPGYAPTYYNLAKILGDGFSASDAAGKALDNFSIYADADSEYLEKAKLYKLQIEAALQGQPPAPALTTNIKARKIIDLGLDYMKKAKLNSAEDCFVKATETDPKSYEAMLQLATVRYTAKNFNAAVEAYQKAAALNPASVDPIYMQGVIAYALGDAAKATQILAGTAIPKWPADPRSYEVAAYAWYNQNRNYEVRVYGEEFIAVSKAAGKDVSAFENWLSQIQPLPFQP